MIDLTAGMSAILDKAKQAITTKIADIEREAKILELEELDSSTMAENEFAYYIHGLIQQRLNQLKEGQDNED